jgi:hypothetical protein
MAPVPLPEQPEDHMMGSMGWIVAVVLVAFVLPLGAFLYLDILTALKQTEKALEKIEKIEKRIERKERDKKPDTFADNPLFDRVRRPFSLSLPRSKKLGSR